MKKKIVLFLCVMGIMTVLTGCSSGSKEIYTPQNIQEKKAKKWLIICEKGPKRGLQRY